MPIVTPFLNPSNYGGLKKSSTTHYLLNLLKFIHEELNEDKPQAVMLTQGDMQKAFNKVSHFDIIVDLQAMKVPGWLLRILCSYLKNRLMTLTMNGVTSSSKKLNGSCPQGVFLGGLLFHNSI